MFNKIKKDNFFWGFALNTIIGIISFTCVVYAFVFGKQIDNELKAYLIIFGSLFSLIMFLNFIANKNKLIKIEDEL